jgi:hypothetical protein
MFHFSRFPFHNLRQEIKAIGSELNINEMDKVLPVSESRGPISC